MRIGTIARQARVSKSIIRYYEGKGVLPRAVRDEAGCRVYGEAELRRIRFVTRARRLGCSFAEIKAMIALQESRLCPPSNMLILRSRKITKVDSEMERMRQILVELLRLQDLGLSLAERAGLCRY